VLLLNDLGAGARRESIDVFLAVDPVHMFDLFLLIQTGSNIHRPDVTEDAPFVPHTTLPSSEENPSGYHIVLPWDIAKNE